MRSVDLSMTIRAPIDQIWATISDIEAYPSFMQDVLETRITRPREGGKRASFWCVTLKGSILEWEEDEVFDDDHHTLVFEQTDGDLERLTGQWDLGDQGEGLVSARLVVEFEIGIPLLADMLEPLAAKAIYDNSQRMLLDVERRVAP